MATAGDREILNSVVNPLLPLGEGVYDDENAIPKELKDQESDTELVRQSRELERQAISKCEAGSLPKAIELFSKAIGLAPERPACYNNRAQAHRLQGQKDKALEDLNKAIQLSGGQGRSACQAFCQRGLLHRVEGRDDEAMSDFHRASDLGSAYAKSLLVQLNPYAAMCNKMLKNMVQALEEGKEQVENPFLEVQDFVSQQRKG